MALFLLWAFSPALGAQNQTNPPKEKKEEAKKVAKRPTQKSTDKIIVTASRKEAWSFDVPFTTWFFDGDQVPHRNSRTIPHLLEEEPSVLVQKTSSAQESPFMRGFTGFRTLFLIDGIRLNNSTFREGPNQYWSTVDPFLIHQMELVKGPSSVLYGSDAIGGTVNVITREPGKSDKKGFQWKGWVFYRYGSADTSHTGRVETQGSSKDQWGFIGGVTYRDFNDTTAGRGTGLQPKTGYRQGDGDFKILYHLNKKSKLIAAYQHTSQDDAWRSHKTIYGISWQGTTIGNEFKRVLEQDRDLVYLQIHHKNPGNLVEEFKASISFHSQREFQFRVRSNGRPDRQGFEANTLGAWWQARTPLLKGDLTYGMEYYRDFVNSYRKDFNADGTLRSVRIQGPVGDGALYDLLGIFGQYELGLIEDRLIFTLGGRFTYARAEAEKVEDPQTGNQIAVRDSYHAAVGVGRLIFYLHPDYLNIFLGVSQGFRAPNLSDLTRLDTARTNEIETPSPGLKPEKYISLEWGTKWNYRGFQGQIAYYYTFIEDMIIRFPTGNVIGTDQEIQKANGGKGYIHGIEISGVYEFSRGGLFFKEFPKEWGSWSLFGGFAWMEGMVDTFPTSAQIKTKEPIDRLLPATAVVGLRWRSPGKKYFAEVVVKMARHQRWLGTRDAADTQRIPPGGTPGYAIITVRGGVQLLKNLTISAAVENIGNKDYRVHGSGQNEPGINFLFNIDWTF